jgi:hypothetical protein
MISTYFFTYKSLFEGLPALPNIFCFFRKGINAPPLLCVYWIALQLHHVSSVQFKFYLGMRLCEKRFAYLQVVAFTMNF